MPSARQLSPCSRGKIEGLHQTDLSHREIARLVGKSRGAVQISVKRWEEGSSDYIKRSGRKRSTSAREDRLLERLAITDRKVTTRRLQGRLSAACGKSLSRRTINRRLREKEICARRPRKKQQLTREHQRCRRVWAVTHHGWMLEDWKRVVFSDEVKISIGSDGCLYVWRRKGEEFSAECCQSVVQHPTSIMLWGCISFQGVRSLHRIRGRLNSEEYQLILGDVMLPDARRLVGEDFIFQQDNATIHTSRSTRQWLQNNEVNVLDWPAESPDANPTENIWHVLRGGLEPALQSTWSLARVIQGHGP